MKILFAVPFFKNVEFLRKTLASVRCQTDARFEVMVLDDSIDLAEGTAARLLVGEMNDSRFRYHRNSTNLGMAANWNQGLDLAHGFDLVTVLHADDQLMTDFAAKMFEALKDAPNASVFFAEAQIIDQYGDAAFSFPDGYKKLLLPKKIDQKIILEGLSAVKSLIAGNFIFCPTLTFRPDKIQGIRFDSKYRMVLDFDFILRLLLQGHRLVGLYEKPLYQYRRHAENATTEMTQSMLRFDEEIEIYNILSRTLRERGATELSDLASQKTIVKKNLFFNLVKSLMVLNFTAAKRYGSYLKKLSI
jgi:glycosyltransferase involved in cell wall biosynthesis